MIYIAIVLGIIIFFFFYSKIGKEEIKQQNLDPRIIEEKRRAAIKEKEEIIIRKSVEKSNVSTSKENFSVKTNGLYIVKPKEFTKNAIEENLSFYLVFNKCGIVVADGCDYDIILENKKACLNDWKDIDDVKPYIGLAANFNITDNVVRWKVFDNISEYEDAQEYSDEDIGSFYEYEGIICENSIILSSKARFYRQDLMEFTKKEVFKNIVFRFNQVF